MFFLEQKGKLVNQFLMSFFNKIERKKYKRSKRLKFRMYIYRFFDNGTKSLAKPCSECTRWMMIASYIGVEYEVYYTDQDTLLKKYRWGIDESSKYHPKYVYI